MSTDPERPGLPLVAEETATSAMILQTVRSMTHGVRRRLIVRVAGIHAIGGLMTFSYLQQLYPASDAFALPWLNNFMLLVVTELAMAPIVAAWGLRRFSVTARFALEGRAPDAAERARILEEPWRMAARPLVCWVLAAVFIVSGILFRSTFSTAEALELGQIMLIGGAATCAVSYLVLEQTYRPLFAIALAGETPPRPASLGVRRRLLLAWMVSSGLPLLGLSLAPFRESGMTLGAVAVLAGVGFAVGLFSIGVAANAIADPLDQLRSALARVESGDLEVDLAVNDGGEVGQVQAGFNRMVSGLRERAELQDLFSRHVGAEVAERALEVGTGLGGEARRASIIFVDLIGSTAMAEVLPPGEVVATLNAFFQAVVDTVQDEGGWVNKFEGDGALCIFGVPGFQPDHEARALRAARRLHIRLEGLREAHPGLDAGVGVSTGTVVAGNVGTEERYEYTVIGRAVNEAARLTDLAKQRPGRVLAAAASVRAAGEERSQWADRGRVGLRGQQAPTAIFEPALPTTTAAPTNA